jgi:Amt family ammonium transporter
VGFAAFEGGGSRAKHVKSVLFKNLLDHSASALAWFFIGWGIFSGDHPFLGVGNFGDPSNYEYAVLFQQFGFAATATTIISGSSPSLLSFSTTHKKTTVSGRLRLEPYVLLSFILAAFSCTSVLFPSS